MERLSIELEDRDFGGIALPDDLTLSVESYRHHVIGGPEKCAISGHGSADRLWECLGWLRYGVKINDEQGDPAWWGFINAVEIQIGQTTYGVSLDEMANRVTVIYGRVTDGEQSTTQAIAGYVDNADSISVYGIKEALLTMANATDDAAFARRDNALALAQVPLITWAQGDGSNLQVAISCRGWWDTLGWRQVVQDDGVINNLVESAYARYVPVPGVWSIAQSFTTPANVLRITSAQLKARKVGSPTGQMRMFLCSDSGGFPGTALSQVDVAMESLAGLYTSPKFRGETSAGPATASTSVTIARSTKIVNDDLMLLSISHADATGIMLPAGWVLLTTQLTGTMRLSIYSKTAANEPASYAITLSVSSRIAAALVGYGETGGIDLFASQSTGTASTAMIAPTATPTQADGRLVFIGAIGVASGLSGITVAKPSTMTERTDYNNSVDRLIYVADELLDEIVATGTRTAVISSSQPNTATVLVLKPKISTATTPWVRWTFPDAVTLTPSTTYWLQVNFDAAGGVFDTNNSVEMAYSAGNQYSGGRAVYSTNGSSWTESTNNDRVFAVSGDQESTSIIAATLQTYGQFLDVCWIEQVSGRYTSAYAAPGDATAQTFVEELLQLGSTTAARLLARVEPDRSVTIYPEPVESSITSYRVTADGRYLTRYGLELAPSRCPVGVWLTIADLVPASANLNQIATASAGFVEANEYHVAHGTATPTMRGRKSIWELG